MRVFLFLALLLAPSLAWAQKVLSNDKAASWAYYSLRHPMHEVVGKSTEVNALGKYDEQGLTFKEVAVVIPVKSFDSNNQNRDSHVLELVQGLKYPNIQFASTEIVKQGYYAFNIKGILTFKGVKKPIQFTTKTWIQDKKQVFVQGSFDVSMRDFGIEPPSFMMVPAEDKIKINFRVVFNK